MQQQFTGDFSIKYIKLYPVTGGSNSSPIDIKELVREISISESVISASVYCNLVITDIGENLIGTLPLMGQERLEISISSPTTTYVLNYVIFKIDGRVMQEKNQAYLIHAVSEESLLNESRRICERVNGIKADEFLKEKLSLLSKKQFESDPTLYSFDMYVPNWRLFDTAIWMSRRSVSSAFKDSIGYLFYETLEGYKFKSVDVLFNQQLYPNNNVKYTFIQGNTGAKNSSANNYRIINYSSPKVFDLFEDLRNGAFSHNSIYVDINNGTYKIYKTTADDYWSDMKHLGGLKPYRSKNSLIPETIGITSRMIYRPTTINTFNWKEVGIDSTENIDEPNKNYEKLLYRYYFLEYNKLEIAVPGDLGLRVGKIIYVSIPSPKKSSDGKIVEDTRISGKYLVHSVKHTIINRTELRTTVTLTRDSFGGNNISDRVVPGRQVNLGENQ